MERINSAAMTCDLFIRSYYRDFPWLRYCLRAIEKYCHGFRDTVLVLPYSSRERAAHAGLETPRTFSCRNYSDDYLGQQVTKLFADTYTDADFICHVDADCIFRRRTEPSDLFRGSCPEVWLTPCTALPNPGWCSVTERVLGEPVHFDFMRRPPFVYPRWLYAEVRRHILALHGMEIEEYVLLQPPRGFSEFNVLGAYAYARYRDSFSWRQVGPQEPNEMFCRWYWSWSGISNANRIEIEAILA